MVAGLAVGVVLGWLTADVSLGISAALAVVGAVAAFYAFTTLRLGAMARWAVAGPCAAWG